MKIVKHYNNQLDTNSKVEDVNFKAKALKPNETSVKSMMRSEIGGGASIFGIRFGASKDIIINIDGGKIVPLLNTANNIKNSLVHEHQHQKDKGGYNRAKLERRAIEIQKSHSTYSGTTPQYKQNLDRYEKIYQ